MRRRALYVPGPSGLPSNLGQVEVNGGDIRCMMVDGDLLYIGGAFTSIEDASGTIVQSWAACLNLVTGLWTSWNPVLNATVYALEKDSTHIYLGGAFTTVNGVGTQEVVRVAKSNAANDTGFVCPTVGNLVQALLLDGTSLYIGGPWTTPAGRIEKLNAATGAADGSFTGGLGAESNHIVKAGSELLVSGLFTTPKRYAVRLNASSGADIGTNYALTGGTTGGTCLYDGTNSYIGGNFTTQGGSNTRNGAAKFDASNVLTAWNPNITGGSALSLLIDDGWVYIAGFFTSVGGLTRRGIVRVDESTGTLDATFPYLASDGAYRVARHAATGTIIIAGSFNSVVIGGQTRVRIAFIRPNLTVI